VASINSGCGQARPCLPTKRYMKTRSQDKSWFNQARYGMFIHWGPYAEIGRGEQVLFREHLDQRDYAKQACRWNPKKFDAVSLAITAREAGMKYAVFTARHHDGYCLWNTALSDYGSVAQAPGRDFVREYVETFRAAGLRVGIYYSLADWRVPAYWLGAKKDPAGWKAFRDYVHGQVAELLTNYGKIDVIWFDGVWPHKAKAWKSAELIKTIRSLQPGILINNRLDSDVEGGGVEQAGVSKTLGDFGTPEHQISADKQRPWESCQVTSWRLWGYAKGEHYRSAEQLLDLLAHTASQGGNLLLNVGLDGAGKVPPAVSRSLLRVGKWLQRNGDAIYGSEKGDVTEFTTYGYQTRRGKALYLICRFWPYRNAVRLPGVITSSCRAKLLGFTRTIRVNQNASGIEIQGLPEKPPHDLFPVIQLDFPAGFSVAPWARERLWSGNPSRMTAWSRSRGTSVWADGKERPKGKVPMRPKANRTSMPGP